MRLPRKSTEWMARKILREKNRKPWQWQGEDNAVGLGCLGRCDVWKGRKKWDQGQGWQAGLSRLFYILRQREGGHHSTVSVKEARSESMKEFVVSSLKQDSLIGRRLAYRLVSSETNPQQRSPWHVPLQSHRWRQLPSSLCCFSQFCAESWLNESRGLMNVQNDSGFWRKEISCILLNIKHQVDFVKYLKFVKCMEV